MDVGVGGTSGGIAAPNALISTDCDRLRLCRSLVRIQSGVPHVTLVFLYEGHVALDRKLDTLDIRTKDVDDTSDNVEVLKHVVRNK